MRSWSFLTNHALVLLHISQEPDSTGLQIALAIGITERAIRSILTDLEVAGYIERERVGRRNRYRVDRHRPLGHFGARALTVGQLLELVAPDQDTRKQEDVKDGYGETGAASGEARHLARAN